MSVWHCQTFNPLVLMENTLDQLDRRNILIAMFMEWQTIKEKHWQQAATILQIHVWTKPNWWIWAPLSGLMVQTILIIPRKFSQGISSGFENEFQYGSKLQWNFCIFDYLHRRCRLYYWWCLSKNVTNNSRIQKWPMDQIEARFWKITKSVWMSATAKAHQF